MTAPINTFEALKALEELLAKTKRELQKALSHERDATYDRQILENRAENIRLMISRRKVQLGVTE